MVPRRALTLGLSVLLVACYGPRDDFGRAGTDAALRSVAMTVVPLAVNADSGRRLLEGHGFACALAHNQPFGPGARIDYVHCDRSTQLDFFVSRRSQLALVLSHDSIVDVRAATGLIGP